MFGSAILDVALGTVFMFLAVSLAASAVTEAIASVLKLRHATLFAGVKQLLNDPDAQKLAKALYEHALINPLSSGSGLTRKPAYIAGEDFALALHDILQTPQPGRPLGDIVAEIADPQLKQTLTTLLRTADDDVTAFQARLATWFDSAMDRVSGVYKRLTQYISFAVALAVAALLNADILHLAGVLWGRAPLATAMTAGMTDGGKNFSDIMARLDQARLIGWSDWTPDPKASIATYVFMLLGWLVAAAAAQFGAAFWFDVLQKVAWVKGVGSAPGRAAK